MPTRTEISEDMPPACLTFFVPPNDGTDETNEQLLTQIHKSGKFDRSGSMFVTTEPDDMFRRGGQFPVFHVEESESSLRQLLGGGPGQPRFLPHAILGAETDTRQGLYRQVHRFEYDDRAAAADETACILMAFKAMQPDPDPELVAHWKTWTGARGLLVDFGGEVTPQSTTFYVRERPQEADLFMYVVLISVFVTKDTWCTVRHLVQRFRVERQFGYISVYRELGSAGSKSRG